MILHWYIHEITGGTLYIAKRETYEIYKKQCKGKDDISEEEWVISSVLY